MLRRLHHEQSQADRGGVFRRVSSGDHAAILALLTDGVVWDLPGHALREGKGEFDREIDNEAFTGRPTLALDLLVEEGDAVVAIGTGAASMKSGETHRFAYCDVFTFAGDLIRRVESYLVPLTGEAPAQGQQLRRSDIARRGA